MSCTSHALCARWHFAVMSLCCQLQPPAPFHTTRWQVLFLCCLLADVCRRLLIPLALLLSLPVISLALGCVQVADIFFGSDAHPHDYLHEVLFRLVSVSWIGAAAQNLVNKVLLYLLLLSAMDHVYTHIYIYKYSYTHHMYICTHPYTSALSISARPAIKLQLLQCT